MVDGKLLIMKKYLDELNLKTSIHKDKLYLITSKRYEKEIQEKAEELGILYCIEQKPVYKPRKRPPTLKSELTPETEIYDFILTEWFEAKKIK